MHIEFYRYLVLSHWALAIHADLYAGIDVWLHIGPFIIGIDAGKCDT